MNYVKFSILLNVFRPPDIFGHLKCFKVSKIIILLNNLTP